MTMCLCAFETLRLFYQMNRSFVDQSIWRENKIELSPEESHHLLDVIRARTGETIEIFDGLGRMARAELISGSRRCARVKILPETVHFVEKYCPAFILLQSVPKQANMELIVQKATELGVSKIVPVITERTVVKMAGPHTAVRPLISAGQGCPALPADKHVMRWRKIALAAAKQCHAAWLPEVLPVVHLDEAIAALRADLKIFGSLVPQTADFKEALAKTPRVGIKSIALAIGPEGDFTDDEIKKLLESGFIPVSFGNEVLRVETAAIYGLSVLKYEFRMAKFR